MLKTASRNAAPGACGPVSHTPSSSERLCAAPPSSRSWEGGGSLFPGMFYTQVRPQASRQGPAQLLIKGAWAWGGFRAGDRPARGWKDPEPVIHPLCLATGSTRPGRLSSGPACADVQEAPVHLCAVVCRKGAVSDQTCSPPPTPLPSNPLPLNCHFEKPFCL